MSALAHFIERAGVATVCISLVREQTEKVCPPRALWVPFALGRPVGVPGDAEFQTNVLRAAFGLLESATEPTIEDYAIEAPEAGPAQWACPLNLATPPDDSLSGRLTTEVAGLRPWAAETRRRRGRTTFGLSGASEERVDDVVAALAAVAESGELDERPVGDIEWSHEMPFLLRHLADDVRSFYHEAVASQPGDPPPNHDALNTWIFGETVLGEVLLEIGDHLTAAADNNPFALLIRNFIIPEGHYRGIANFGDMT